MVVGTIVKSNACGSTGYIRGRSVLRGFCAVKWTGGPLRGVVQELVPAENLRPIGSLKNISVSP
jgi:hypothetical protein